MILLILSLFSLFAQGSPHPLSGSSIINYPQYNFAYSQLGFKIAHVPDGWIFKTGVEDSAIAINLGPADPKSNATLVFHQEKASQKSNLEQYVRQYLRDYNQYGFEVTNLQSNKKSLVPSIVVDLTQKNKKTRSRQIFYLQNDKVIVASCLDDYDQYEKTIQSCNQILDSFQWTN